MQSPRLGARGRCKAQPAWTPRSRSGAVCGRWCTACSHQGLQSDPWKTLSLDTSSLQLLPPASRTRFSHFQKWAQLPPLLQEAALRPPLPGPGGRVRLPPPRLHPGRRSPKLPARGGGPGVTLRLLLSPGWPAGLRFRSPVGPSDPPSSPCSSPPPHSDAVTVTSPPRPARQAPRALPCPHGRQEGRSPVPCQACECAAPPSPARNAAAPRGRPQTPGSGQARPSARAVGQVAPACLGLGVF